MLKYFLLIPIIFLQACSVETYVSDDIGQIITPKDETYVSSENIYKYPNLTLKKFIIELEKTSDVESLMVFFDFDKDNIRPNEAKKIRHFLDSLPDEGVIHIAGHTDIRGSKQYNANLSARRAKAVEKFIKEDIKQSNRHILYETIFFGKNNPLLQGTSEIEHQINRRVTVIFSKAR